MRFDHLIHLVPDLEWACSEYERLGFSPRKGGEHPGHGTHNAAVRSGSTYIELLGVRDWAEFWKYEEERTRRYPRLVFRTKEILYHGGGASGGRPQDYCSIAWTANVCWYVQISFVGF